MVLRGTMPIIASLTVMFMTVDDVISDHNIQHLQTEKLFYLEKGQFRLVERVEARFTNGSSITLACYRYGKRKIIENVLNSERRALIIEIDRTEMNFMLNKCSEFLENTILRQPESGIPLSGTSRDYQYIYPGTKWCGSGTVANHYNDLGSEMQTDLCCREHDFCNDTIESKMIKYGLINEADYTRSHCDCDEKFSKCLKKTNTRSANNVGNLFFNKLTLQCFKMDHPIIKCLSFRRHWVFFSRKETCEDYEFDKHLPPTWQFFDPIYYE
uniref:Phospholipase A2 n=1 Tax=Liphistius sp. SGP-2016 TaxID=1905180 RepID=A0A4Q8K2W1_9ARAC